MATLKFIASDSATAMEEVIKKLGPEALIVSTSKRGNKVEIEATNDRVTPKINLSKASHCFLNGGRSISFTCPFFILYVIYFRVEN